MKRFLLPFCLFLTLFCYQITIAQLESFSEKEWPKKRFLKNTNQKIDYSNLDNWAAHTAKNDLSDKNPKSLDGKYILDKQVDVFFVHPTSYYKKTDSFWNADITNTDINKETDEGSIKFQASIFNVANVYAPRYRQAHITAYYTGNRAQAKKAFDIAYKDVADAFDYFIQHLNNSKPFIIAGHSQGTQHAAKLIKEKIENSVLKNRLVVAYLVGMPVPQNYFKTISACNDSTSTGCVVSWRTYAQDYIDPNFVANEKSAMIVTNPLTWSSTDTSWAKNTLHKGAVLTDFSNTYKNFIDARIKDNVLWVGKPNIIGADLFKMKNYHKGDYNIFYVNIKENVITRIGSFWKK